jgi:hypothetical protein
MDNERFLKLPKWAQQEIRRLEINLQSAKSKINTLLGPEDETNVVLREGINNIPLPEDSLVRFYLEEKPYAKYIEISLDDNELRVQGSETIYIKSGFSNVCFIKLEDQ